MENQTHHQQLGKVVISASFGEGVISEVTEMSGEPFFIVLNQTNNMRHYVPINDSKAYRYLSNEKKFSATITEHLVQKKYKLSFDSKKDRINYYKEQAKDQRLEVICKNIKSLHETDDKGSLEEQIYIRLIENLCLEYSLIKNFSLEDAQTHINPIIQSL